MMNVPISKRLRLCASFVVPGQVVADIGCDHGYLGIYLLQQNLAAHVIASDLRPQPLQKARENAKKFCVSERMEFYCADGLDALQPGRAGQIVCAGMGADSMIALLAKAPWVGKNGEALILQPQSSGQDLRAWLCAHGFSIQKEALVEEKGFFYTVLQACYTGKTAQLSPGQQYVSAALLQEGSALLPQYLQRLSGSLMKTAAQLENVAGMEEKQQYYACAWREIEEMRKKL